MSTITPTTSTSVSALTDPLLLSSGLTLTELFAIDSAYLVKPGIAVVPDNNSGGGLNAVEIQNDVKATISVAGTGAQEGHILRVFIDNKLVLSHVLLASEISNGKGEGSGYATVLLPAAELQALSQGQHGLTSQIDYGTSLSAVSAVRTLNIDTIAPNTPSAPKGTDDAGEDTGNIVDNSVIDDATPLISGTIAQKDNYIDVFDNGKFLATVYADTAGAWTYKFGKHLADGAHAISVIEYDRAGNPSPMSPALHFVLDTGPVNVSITKATDNVGLVQGDVGNYGTTDDATPTLVGTARGNAVVTIKDGGLVLGTTIADALGNWSFTPTTVQKDGAHIYTASITVAGNTATSPGFSISVDTTTPTTIVTPVGDDLKTASEATSAAGVMTISGEADSTSTVVFQGQNGKVTKTLVNNGSTKPVVLSAADLTTLGDGAVEVTTTTRDKLGRVTVTTDVKDGDFVLDTKPPKAVADVVNVDEDVVKLSNSLSANDTNKDGSETYSLIGSNQGKYGYLLINADGSYTYTRTENLNGIQATATDVFTYQVSDAAGNPSTSTLTINMAPVNDAPVNVMPTVPLTVAEDTAKLISGLQITDVDAANSTMSVTLGVTHGTMSLAAGTGVAITGNNTASVKLSGTVTAINTLLEGLGAVKFVPEANFNGAASLSMTTSDGKLSDTDSVNITVTAVNDAPILVTPLGDQTAALNKAFSYTVPVNSFTDVDSTLTYSATLANGNPLPAWLTFNPVTRTFSGTPTTTADVSVKVTASDGTLSASDTFLIGVPPVVTNVDIVSATGAQNHYLNAGDVFSATVTFSENVSVTGDPTLALNVGGSLVQAHYASTSGNTVTFKYTVAAGLTDTNGISIGANALNVSGGTIKDAAGNNAVLASAAVTDDANYMVDTSAPTLTMSMASTSLSSGQSTKVTFNFSEAVTGFTSSDVIVPNGSLSSLTTTDQKTWTATFTADSSSSSNHLSVAANSFADAAGNNGVAASGPTYSLNTSVQDIAQYLGLRYDGGSNFGCCGAADVSIAGKTSTDSSYFWNDSWNDILSRATFSLHKVHGCCDTVVDTATYNMGQQRVTFDRVGCVWNCDDFYATVTYNGSTVALKYGFELHIWCSQSWSENYSLNTPLMLDLNGDGVQTLSMNEGVQFDLNNTGSKQSVGWASKQDGWLAMDLNGDGQINSGAELFGEHTRLADGAVAKDGWAALAQFDSNGDGKIDVQDARFNDLRVWVDANSDGITDAGELRTLTEAHVSSVDLKHDGKLTGQNGNVLQGFSTFTTTDGVKHEIADALLKTGSNASDATPDCLTLNTINADGQATFDAAVGGNPKDAMLVWDKYQDGLLHDGSQITFTQNGGKTDLAALAAAFDTQQDGVFDVRDAKFSQFAVWQDANQNGISDAGELRSLADVGIQSIQLTTAPTSASNDVVNLSDVLPAPDWQANDVTSAHLAYTLNTASLLADDLSYKIAA